MVDPEIARRCRFCGASIRARSLFCPQCGKPTTDISADSAAAGQSLETEEVFDAAKTVALDFPGLPIADLPNQTATNAETMPLQPFTKQSDGVRQQGHAAADVKRGFERVREISTVVLDEAAYDPSARFVLVAAVLFVLFLIILILSEMMR